MGTLRSSVPRHLGYLSANGRPSRILSSHYIIIARGREKEQGRSINSHTSLLAREEGRMGFFPPILKRYRVPLVLFSFGLLFQLVILPASFPPSHYDLLGVKRHVSVEEVAEAYDKLSSKWNSSVDLPSTTDFIKIRYAFELLTNPLWKRDYDLFGIDEHSHIIEKAKAQYNGESFSKVALPLLDISVPDSVDAFNVLTSDEFISKMRNETTLLIQVYSLGSPRCIQFFDSWKRIASSLDGVAEAAMVEVGEVHVVSYLAERKPTNQPFFQNGLPALVAFPPNCRSSDCLVRYEGDLSEYEVVDWIATTILGLPRILYYSKESLGPNFIAKSGRHKVKVIFFSKTGIRVDPFVRQAAKDYWEYASFASVFWREQDSSIWWNIFQVESAPAIIFLKDPGVRPVVHHGSLNSSVFHKLMEHNKHLELPQLRTVTSMALGCDARGFSRAGNDTMTWYCVILAGRPSLELNKMRETMRKVQSILSNDSDMDSADKHDLSLYVSAAAAFKEKRLTFVWLDGEAQQKYCLFYLHTENIYDTCGPRRYGDPTDVPRLFIVRYKRNSTEANLKVERKPKTIWDAFREENGNQAYQLAAPYDGSDDVHKIIEWISKIIVDGETRILPDFIATTPELIPEDSSPVWSKGAHGIVSASRVIKHRLPSIFTKIYAYMTDPRLGPALFLGACLSFGTIWLQRNQTTQPTEKVEVTSNRKDRRRDRTAKRSDADRPSSITDFVPKDAIQMLSSGSDSE